MAGFSGTNLDVKWLYTTGTTVLTGDFRQFNYNPAIELLDETAGADANQLFIPYLKSGQAQFTSLLQTGTGAGGTAMTAVLTEGNFGTLVVSPNGTAAGSQKLTIPAYSGGVQLNEQYNALVEVSVTFTQSGARTEGTN